MFRFVKKLRPYLSEYKKQLIFFVVMVAISMFVDIIKIFLTVDLMEFNANTPTTKIVTVIFCIAVFTILISILGYISQITLDFITINISKKVREDIYRHISKIKMDYSKDDREADFLTRWAKDLQTTQDIFRNNITSLIRTPVATVIYTIYLVNKRWDLFLVTFFPVFVTIIVTNTFGKYMRKKVEENTQQQAKLNNVIKDSVICIQIVNVYMLFEKLKDKFERVNDKIYKISLSTTKTFGVSLIINNLMKFDMESVMCYAYGGYLCYIGKMELANLFVFKFISSALTNCIVNLPNMISGFRANTFYINRVFDIFDYEIEEIQSSNLEDVACENHIKFENVSFSYGQNSILKDCSFEIKKGERVAIVGENCKTTICNLICGFYQAGYGNISICGHSIDKNSLDYIRKKISIVEQEPRMFLGTIKENILCGYDYHEKRFEDATTISVTNNFVERFSNEYNTRISGQSTILSGGQCQRINLARALYKDSEIMLLDNYTSALDSDTKNKIYKNMNNVRDRTIVVFSNNSYDLCQVDRVILLKDGQVYSEGTHKALFKECAYYRSVLDKE